MSSVVIAGDTSGSVTLQAPATAGSVVVTLPSVSGTLSVSSGSPTYTNLAYTGTLTGGTGIVNLGSGQFYKDASGNVGVGTTSPLYTSAGRGNINIGGSAGAILGLQVGGVAKGYLFHDSTNYQLWNEVNGPMLFATNALERMRIDSSGNVGIGTSSPLGKLDVSSSATFTPFFISSTYTGNAAQRNWAIGSSINSFGDLSFNTSNAQGGNPISAGTTRMVIDSSGNVGIGTSSPSNKLHIVGTNATQQLRIDAPGNASGVGISADSTNGNAIYYGGNDNLRFVNVSTERMRIDSSGRLLVNRTTANAQMCLNYAGNSIEGFSINDSASSSGSAAVRFQFGGTGVGGITLTGSNTSYQTSSDYRLKENIAPMVGALATVSALKPCTYKWKRDGSDGQGFIAHELQEVCPDAVCGEKDAIHEDGSIKSQGIDTSFLVATLTAAIQELNAKVEAQAAQIAALTGAK